MRAIPYDAEFAQKIGGYPQGVVVRHDGRLWVSTIFRNLAEPGHGRGWRQIADAGRV